MRVLTLEINLVFFILSLVILLYFFLCDPNLAQYGRCWINWTLVQWPKALGEPEGPLRNRCDALMNKLLYGCTCIVRLRRKGHERFRIRPLYKRAA